MTDLKLHFYGNLDTVSMSVERFLSHVGDRPDAASRFLCDVLCTAPRHHRQPGDAATQFAALSESEQVKHVCRANEILNSTYRNETSATFARLTPEWSRQELTRPTPRLICPPMKRNMQSTVEDVLLKLNGQLALQLGTLHEQGMERSV